MTPRILVIDAGTTSVKVCLFSAEMALEKKSIQEYDLNAAGNRVEADGSTYVEAISRGIRALKAEKECIAAVSLTTQGETMTVTDADGCVSSKHDTVTVYGIPVLELDSRYNAICEGDSVTIGNRKYAKLVNGGLYTPVSGSRISQNTEGRDYVIGIRHEGGRVYVNYAEYQDYLRQRGYSQYYDVFPHGNPDYIPYATTADGEMVLYDYTMEVGDGFVHVEGYDDVTVVSKEIIMLDNQTARRRLVLSNGLVLIEGIGCINSNGMLLDYLNPLSSLQTRFTYLNLLFDLNTNTKVYENSEIEVYDLRRLAVPEVMQNEKKGERTAYDLQGRPLKQKPSKGLYIENGKKMIVQ